MQYRTFGKHPWQASVLGFGCMRLPVIGGNSGNIDQEKVDALIRRALEAGINYFDTAYTYHEQTSESALGKALRGGLRDKVRIATKLPVWLVNEPADFERLLEEQLTRLQTNHIDVYLLHSLNRTSWQKVQQLGLLERAEAAKARGVIGHIGFSFHDNLDTFKAIVDGYAGWDFCQIQYNYVDVDYQAGKTGLQYAASRGLAVIVMEPLRGGKLALSLPAAQPLWDAHPVKRSPADWALQWVWSQPQVTLALSGMTTMQQLEENIVSASASQPGLLTGADLALLERVREALKSLSPIPCTSCEYCLPCPQGVNIPHNFELYNQAAMFSDVAASRFAYERFMDAASRASQCVQCDECLPKCPQNIPISAWMPVVEQVLGLNQPYVTEL